MSLLLCNIFPPDGFSNFFPRKQPAMTGKKLSGTGDNDQCCPIGGGGDGTVTGFDYNSGTYELTITTTDSSFIVDLSSLAPDGNVNGVSYDPATGQLTVTDTLGNSYTTTISSVPTTINNTLFVKRNGNNGTAQPYRFDRQYATPWAAVADASSGDTVVVYPGIYTVGASDTSARLVKDGVNVYLMPGVIIVVANAATADLFSDDNNPMVSGIYGEGELQWNSAAEMLTASNTQTRMVMRWRRVAGRSWSASDYKTLDIEVIDNEAAYAMLTVAPTVSLSESKLRYVVHNGVVNSNIAANMIRIACPGGVNIEDSQVDIDINAQAVQPITASMMMFDGIGVDTALNINAVINDTIGGQTGYIMQLRRFNNTAVINADIQATWSYGLILVPQNVGCQASGTIAIKAKVNDHAPLADLDLRGSQGGLQLDVDLNVDGASNTIGVVQANGPTGSCRRTHISGRIRSTSTTPPIYLTADPSPAMQYASLSHLTIFTNALATNNVNAGPGGITAQVNKVRSNKAMNVALFTQQGEIVQVVATTLV